MAKRSSARSFVFVSYAREDEEFVDRALVPALEQRGQRLWVDRTNLPAGAEFPSRISAAIRESTAFIYVLSPWSVSSSWCLRELAEASSQSKKLVPVVVGEVG